MTDQQLVQGYARLGLTTYIESRLDTVEKPKMVIVGQLEWFAILDLEATDEYSIKGVPVVPDMNVHSIVSVR